MNGLEEGSIKSPETAVPGKLSQYYYQNERLSIFRKHEVREVGLTPPHERK